VVARKQVFGSEGMVAGMGCQIFALCGWGIVLFVFKSSDKLVSERFFRIAGNGQNYM
jgi:hypothetical protein